jgi:hypothetical protein
MYRRKRLDPDRSSRSRSTTTQVRSDVTGTAPAAPFIGGNGPLPETVWSWRAPHDLDALTCPAIDALNQGPRHPQSLPAARRASLATSCMAPCRSAGSISPTPGSSSTPDRFKTVSGPEPPRPPVPPTEQLGARRQPRQPVAVERVEHLPPELPPDRRWGNPWAAVVAGIVGALLGVLIGLAVGNNNTKTVRETQRAGQPAVTQTVTQPKVEAHTNTVTVTTTTPAAVNAENEVRTRETEKNLRKVEKENEELKRQLEREGRPVP